MNDAESNSGNSRPRFSLLNLVALMTIVALAVGLYSSAQRNTQLDERNQQLVDENKQFRNELGVFEIEDATQIHAIRAPTEDDEPRRYRIYLPPGYKYTRCYKTNRIPESGVPECVNANPLEPGHYVFRIEIERRKDEKTGEPIPYATVKLEREQQGDTNSRSSSFISVGERQNDWLVNKQTGNTAFGWQEPGKEVEFHDPSEPFVLYRARARQVQVQSKGSDGKPTSWSSKNIAGETDGFMVWIESEKVEAGAPE